MIKLDFFIILVIVFAIFDYLGIGLVGIRSVVGVGEGGELLSIWVRFNWVWFGFF